MVDRTLPQQARAAVDGLSHHAGALGHRPRGDVIGGSEHRHCRDPEGGGHVHGARVVREIDRAGCRQINKLSQGCRAGEIVSLGTRPLRDLRAKFSLCFRAENRDVRVKLGCQSRCRFRKALRQPSFRPSVGRSRTDPDPAFGRQFPPPPFFPPGLGGTAGAGEPNIGTLWNSLDQAGPPQEFQIIESLVCREMALWGKGNRVGQQRSPRISGVADSARYPGQPRNQCGVKGVLQQDCTVEARPPQFSRQLPFPQQALVAPIVFVAQNVVAEILARVEVGHPGARKKGDLRLRKGTANLPQGRDRHHGVAQPVGGTDQELH